MTNFMMRLPLMTKPVPPERWTDVGPSPQPFAIAGLVEVEWDETNARHSLELTIENEDGAPLIVPTPTGDQPVRVASEFEVGRPAGSARGSSFNMALAVPIIPLPWTPGRRYVVRLRIEPRAVDDLARVTHGERR